MDFWVVLRSSPGDDGGGAARANRRSRTIPIHLSNSRKATRPHSRGAFRPGDASFAFPLEDEEGAGNAGCALHPRSRVQYARKEAHTSIQVKRRHSGIPCAMVLRLIPCSPRRRIRLVTVVCGLTARPARLGEVCLRRLGASNGRQDHTALPYAHSAFAKASARQARLDLTKAANSLRRLARRNRSRGSSRPATTAARWKLPRPPHSRPTSVTIAIRPLLGPEQAGPCP